jgi:transcriptional regulator with XRE-family HTH domain
LLSLGRTIRTRRIELGLTQEQLAERIGGGVRQAEVSRLEADRVTLPRRERLERIAAALTLPVGELLARSSWTGAEKLDPSPRFAAPASAPVPPASDPAPEPVVRTHATAAPHIQRLHEVLERSRQLRAQSDALRQRLDQLYGQGFARHLSNSERRLEG